MSLNWRIYYDDGSTFDDREGEPHSAPVEGVICIIGYRKSGKRYIEHKQDFYMFDIDTNEWWGFNAYGLHDRLRRNLVYAYKEGRLVSDDRYAQILHVAHTDPDFPQ